MTHPRTGATRVLKGFDSALANETASNVIPTGVDLDSERPRAILVEDFKTVHVPGNVADTSNSANVSSQLEFATSPDKFTAGEFVAAVFEIYQYKKIAGALAGAQTVSKFSTEDLVKGTLWVAPWLRFFGRVSDDWAAGNDGNCDFHWFLKYRVVPIPFDLAHALYDQVDEHTEGSVEGIRTWWSP